MHHFQLKPVRSLDSLRPAWSGQIRHGPLPSAVITNPSITTSIKVTSSTPHSTLINSIDQPNVLLNANDTPANAESSVNIGTYPLSSVDSKANKIRMEVDKTSPLVVSQRCIDNAQPNNFLHQVHTSEFTKTSMSLRTQELDAKQHKNKFERSTKGTKFYVDDIFPSYDSDTHLKENDPFDTSKVFMPTYLQPSILQGTNPSLSINYHVPLHAYNSTPCSAYSKVNVIIRYLFCVSVLALPLSSFNICILHIYPFVLSISSEALFFTYLCIEEILSKMSLHVLPSLMNYHFSCPQESPEVPDLIRLDSTASSDDFDPLLSKSSEFPSSKQMTQSLHIPEMGEGLSNPLYPYFQPLHKSNDKQQKSSDNIDDLDLLQAYGLDFKKFGISNGDSSSKNLTVCNTSESSINIDTSFSLTLNAPAIKSQNNWTKFE